jgi:hypothetical protein
MARTKASLRKAQIERARKRVVIRGKIETNRERITTLQNQNRALRVQLKSV